MLFRISSEILTMKRLTFLFLLLLHVCGLSVGFAQATQEQVQADSQNQAQDNQKHWPTTNKTGVLLGLGLGFDVNVLGFKLGIQHGRENLLIRATLGLGISSIPFLINSNQNSFYPNPTIEVYFFRNQQHYLGVGLGFLRNDANFYADLTSSYTYTQQVIPLTINYLQDIGDTHGFQFYGSIGLASYYYYELERDINNPITQKNMLIPDDSDDKKYNAKGESKSIEITGTIGFSYLF
jgi:hypothetical protein